jgi:hypothetical protein
MLIVDLILPQSQQHLLIRAQFDFLSTRMWRPRYNICVLQEDNSIFHSSSQNVAGLVKIMSPKFIWSYLNFVFIMRSLYKVKQMNTSVCLFLCMFLVSLAKLLIEYLWNLVLENDNVRYRSSLILVPTASGNPQCSTNKDLILSAFSKTAYCAEKCYIE